MDLEYIGGVLNEPYAGICVVAIIATIVALVISTRYSLRNLLNIRSVSGTAAITPQRDQDHITKETSLSSRSAPCDIAGNEGDDEAEGDDEVESNALSPRYPDPVDYCEHIQGEIKRVQQKVANKSIAESLTEAQLREEQEIQQKQLADIFRLMQEQQDRFGIGNMDDMQEQMKLYAV